MKFIFFLFIFISSAVLAQQQNVTKGLMIGEAAPDFIFKNVANIKAAEPKLSDYRGKLVILDFWATSCTDCLKAMPKMDSLQRKFEGKIQIILVNPTQTAVKVKEYMKVFRNEDIKKAMKNFPAVVDDLRWKEYFPHRSIPHHVWIDQKGTIVSITGGRNTTEKSIAAFLSGETPEMQIKDDYLDEKFKDAQLSNGGSKPLYTSGFYAFIPNLSAPGYKVDSVADTYYLRLPKSSIYSMSNEFFRSGTKYGNKSPRYIGYEITHGGDRNIYLGNVLDKLSHRGDASQVDAWRLKNQFIYELNLPYSAKNMIRDIAKKDVTEFARMKFAIELKEQEVETECYVIKIDDMKRFKSVNVTTDGYQLSDSLIKLTNLPFENFYNIFYDLLESSPQRILVADPSAVSTEYSKALSNRLNPITKLSSKPVVFDTETLAGNFDFELSGNFRDFEELKQKLAGKGIILSKEKRKVKFLVMKDLADTTGTRSK